MTFASFFYAVELVFYDAGNLYAREVLGMVDVGGYSLLGDG